MIFSKLARRDLEEIARFSVSKWGAARADRYRLALEQTIARICSSPASGVMVPELAHLRSLPSGSHRIYFSYDDDNVRIGRVLHMSMDAPRHLP